ncbi:ABC transporter substrate-binding protein [Haloarcula sp. CGMCC 1.6347]|uniref:ABC transporter substrate-binding protein n=1 Tax=Haloarcula sp. CGMCC 1.6347 TaxID=3111455 RepID=UPI00300F3746
MYGAGQSPQDVSRRAVLGSAAAGLAATSGCMQRLRTLAGNKESPAVSLSIKTRPADEDPGAMHIARQLETWFDTAGVDTTVQPVTATELYRQTLLNHEFDAFVARYPYRQITADSLYSLVHSSFAAERGWQNPFGFADLEVDELLTAQRRQSDDRRAETLASLQKQLANACPFLVIGTPDSIRAANTTRFSGWTGAFGKSPLRLLTLDRADPEATTLRLVTTDSRVTRNLNPLMAPFRRRGRITSLVYDSLARQYQGGLVPWAGVDWEWDTSQPDGPVLRVTLRDDLQWHDGETLTAADVAFTYRMVADTSLGAFEQAVPPTRYRGRATVVTAATAIDERTVELTCTDCSRAVAERALTVPLLAEHVWRERASKADIGGVGIGAATTEALVTDAIPPVGSGPLQFDTASDRESLRLTLFEDHFRTTIDPADSVAASALDPPFDAVEVGFVGSDSTAVELVESGDADATAVGVGSDLVRTIGRADDLTLLLDQGDSFYFLGFNVRSAPLSNSRFRNLLSHLVDRQYLVDTVFDGYATPAVSPLAGTGQVPETLQWEPGGTVTPFLGSDGELDTEQVRSAFREAGYRYDTGTLLQS